MADREAWLERLTTGQDYVAAPLAESALSVVHGEHGEENLTGDGRGRAVRRPGQPRAGLHDGRGLCCAGSHGTARADNHSAADLGYDRRLFDLHFADVLLEEKFTLARGTAAQALTARLATQRDFALAAEAVGGANALLELTVQYLGTRNQFGRPLALFQALKHRCADLKALIAGAEALLLDSLGRIGMMRMTPGWQLALNLWASK